MGGRAVGVMTKYPSLGQVKTRLAADVGDEAALRLYRLLLEQVHREMTGQAQFETFAMVTPRDRVTLFEQEYAGFTGCLEQRGDDLGERMLYALDQLLHEPGCAAAILIGCDVPALSAEFVDKAFAALVYHDLVLGPTSDGGYYLIGMKKLLRPLFEGPPWGGPRVLATTLDIAAANGYAVALLDRLDDLDTLADLRRFPKLAEEADIEIQT